TSGLGKAVAHTLSTQPGRLILHGRDAQRLDELDEELNTSEATIDTVRADLSDRSHVRQLADDGCGLTDHRESLVNNAGIGKGTYDTRQESADGFELRLAVNHLAPFALTLQLLPLLETGAPSRVINVASGAQEPIDFDDPQLKHNYSGNRA